MDCPKCEVTLECLLTTQNTVSTITVQCPACKRSREWKHVMWEDSYIQRAFIDFITLVNLEGEDDD